MELALTFLVISGYLIVGGTVFLTIVTLNRLNERIESSPTTSKSKRRRISKRDLKID